MTDWRASPPTWGGRESSYFFIFFYEWIEVRYGDSAAVEACWVKYVYIWDVNVWLVNGTVLYALGVMWEINMMSKGKEWVLIGQQFQCDVNDGHVCDVNNRLVTKIKLVISCKNCSLFCYRSLTWQYQNMLKLGTTFSHHQIVLKPNIVEAP